MRKAGSEAGKSKGSGCRKEEEDGEEEEEWEIGMRWKRRDGE